MRACLSLVAGLVLSQALAEPVKVSERFGFDPVDSTAFVQKALDSGLPEIVLDRQATAWVTKPLFGRSNQTLYFEDGVELLAKKGEFAGKVDALIRYENVTNVALVGLGPRGGICRMRKDDYHRHPYVTSEWRHGVFFVNAVNFRMENMTVLEAGGDGVDILGARCRNGIVRKVLCDRCNRQGMSVEGVTGLLVEDCVFSNTKGTAPEAGIDFEPFKPEQPMTGIVMRNCRMEGNAGNGMGVFFGESDATTPPYDITVENCRVVGCEDGIWIADYGRSFRTEKQAVKGRLLFRDCTLERCRKCAVRVRAKTEFGPDLSFVDCTSVEVGGNEQRAEVEFFGTTGDGTLKGSNLPANIEFRNFTVRKNNPRPWLNCVCVSDFSTKFIKGVSGNVRVIGPDGKVAESTFGK